MGPPLPIHRPGKLLLSHERTAFEKCAGAPSVGKLPLLSSVSVVRSDKNILQACQDHKETEEDGVDSTEEKSESIDKNEDKACTLAPRKKKKSVGTSSGDTSEFEETDHYEYQRIKGSNLSQQSTSITKLTESEIVTIRKTKAKAAAILGQQTNSNLNKEIAPLSVTETRTASENEASSSTTGNMVTMTSDPSYHFELLVQSTTSSALLFSQQNLKQKYNDLVIVHMTLQNKYEKVQDVLKEAQAKVAPLPNAGAIEWLKEMTAFLNEERMTDDMLADLSSRIQVSGSTLLECCQSKTGTTTCISDVHFRT
ncbi:unnamed protein product [Didymodactylos carnosus]|uniref:Uncharacterized protein n=1 Tax=Didymodactylos carnosus TaxID=1234261 RepID=A0A8S2FGF0_9BILA|nr:unnamed protein product [Didymodactylos carnosus]CAF4261220.1 unnamed protein product [Didymodactylos carnosus]